MRDVIDEIFATFRAHGDEAYLGEPVSQTEHALQTALFAERDGADPLLIASALLHDFGHLVHELPEDCADLGIDSVHEDVGAVWLGRYFGPAVTEPLRLHVAAKRYLCAVDPAYMAALSPASIKSLGLQGGPYDDEERAEFEREPFWREAVALRRYDDAGKIEGLETPPLEHYRPCLEAALR